MQLATSLSMHIFPLSHVLLDVIAAIDTALPVGCAFPSQDPVLSAENVRGCQLPEQPEPAEGGAHGQVNDHAISCGKQWPGEEGEQSQQYP